MGASHSPTKGRFDVPASSHFLNIYSYFILTSSVGSVFATSRGQEEMGRAQRHREPPWGTPGQSRGTAGWHPGRGGEGGTSEPSAGARTRRAVLAAGRRRGRHGSQAQACVRPPVLSSPQEARRSQREPPRQGAPALAAGPPPPALVALRSGLLGAIVSLLSGRPCHQTVGSARAGTRAAVPWSLGGGQTPSGHSDRRNAGPPGRRSQPGTGF